MTNQITDRKVIGKCSDDADSSEICLELLYVFHSDIVCNQRRDLLVMTNKLTMTHDDLARSLRTRK